MNFNDANECYKAETDLFSLQPIQTAVEEGSWHAIYPGPNFQTGTIEFNVSATDEYIDLSQTELYLKCSIRKKGENLINSAFITEEDKIGPVNNFFHSIIDQAVLTVNNTAIENSNGSNGYRAYIENLLTFNKNAKESHLISNVYVKDAPGRMDNVVTTFKKARQTPHLILGPDSLTSLGKLDTDKVYSPISMPDSIEMVPVNEGLLDRRLKFLGRSVEMTGPLHLDLFNANKYLLNRTPFKLTLNRSKADFCLVGEASSESYFVYVEEALLYIRKVQIAPSIMDRHIVTLNQNQNANYPIRRVVVKQLTVPLGIENHNISNIFTGKMPRRLIIGFVDHSAAAGSLAKNPFNFQHFNLSSIKLLIAGHANPYREAVEMDFSKNSYLRGYNTLFKGLDMSIYENGHDISYADFANGYALYAFNLTPDQCDGDHLSVPRIGDVEIALKFSVPTPNLISAVIYLEFDNLIQITNLRQVITDYKI